MVNLASKYSFCLKGQLKYSIYDKERTTKVTLVYTCYTTIGHNYYRSHQIENRKKNISKVHKI